MSENSLSRLAFAGLLAPLLWSSIIHALDPDKMITQYVHRVWRGEDGLPQNAVHAIVQTHDGYLWLGTQEGLVRFDGVRFTVFDKRNTPAITNNAISALHEDREKNLWIGTWGGLVRYRNGSFNRIPVESEPSNHFILCLEEDQNGGLWIGTLGEGLLHMTNGKFTVFTPKQGLLSDRVWSLYEDRKGNLWVGTNAGLNRFQKGSFIPYTIKDGLGSNMIRSIHEDHQGNLWIGTTGGGLTCLKNGKFTVYTTAHGLSSNQVFCIFEDTDKNLWIGTFDRGLNRFRNGQFSAFTAKEGLSHDNIWSIYEDREKNLWVGTFGGGLNLLRDGKLTVYSTQEGLSNNIARSICEARAGTLWIGTGGGGLCRLKQGKFTRITAQEGLSSDLITSFYEDEEKVLWIGTIGGGLMRHKNGRFTSYTRKEGLFDDTVFQVFEDKARNFWMSSNKGIFRVRKEELNDLAEGKIRFITSTSYGKADGMKSVECNGGYQPSACQTRDGRIWFPTVAGVVVVDPDRIQTSKAIPPTLIEEVLADNQPLEWKESLGQPFPVSAGTQRLEFHYTALSFVASEKLQFQYKLESFDREWIRAAGQRVAYYTNIPPGHYRFQVIAANADGVWGTDGSSFRFYLKPYFHQTSTFYILILSAIILLASGSYYLRMRHVRLKEETLIKLVRERTRNLQEVKNQLEMAMAGMAHEIRNPIFTIRSIVYFLSEKLKGLEDMREPLETIEAKIRQLSDLVHHLLDFSKPQSLLLAPTDTYQLLRDAVEAFRMAHPDDDLRVIFQACSPPPLLWVDRTRILQVIANLLENAQVHAQGASRVILSADFVVEKESPPEISIRVEDDGEGIPQEHLPHVFDPFFTTGNGTGLGLAIARRIITEHQGSISVESERGQGTVFLIRLPAYVPE